MTFRDWNNPPKHRPRVCGFRPQRYFLTQVDGQCNSLVVFFSAIAFWFAAAVGWENRSSTMPRLPLVEPATASANAGHGGDNPDGSFATKPWAAPTGRAEPQNPDPISLPKTNNGCDRVPKHASAIGGAAGNGEPGLDSMSDHRDPGAGECRQNRPHPRKAKGGINQLPLCGYPRSGPGLINRRLTQSRSVSSEKRRTSLFPFPLLSPLTALRSLRLCGSSSPAQHRRLRRA